MELYKHKEPQWTGDGYWADDACIDEHRADDDQIDAKRIDLVPQESGWQGLYVGGTAFKKQREVEPKLYAKSGRLAARFMDVVVASGITQENAHLYADHVDLFMVATGVNIDNGLYNIDSNKLIKLIKIIEK